MLGSCLKQRWLRRARLWHSHPGDRRMDRYALTFNAGSSSLKLGLFRLADGRGVRIGGGAMSFGDGENFSFQIHDRAETVRLSGASTRKSQVKAVVDHLLPDGAIPVFAGHRIVHGGPKFDQPVQLGKDVLASIEALAPFAPMHLPPALEIARAVWEIYPGLPQTASFDTAFHASQSSLASRFAIPRELHDAGVRRYGFHGLSYKYIAGALRRLDPDLASSRVICAHLGSGASLCGMVDGVSIDTSMGFSALDGVPMATRPGAIDAGAVIHLLRHDYRHADDLENFLYHKCGLLGVSGKSGDVKVLLEDCQPASREAVDLFCFRIAGEIGRLAVSIGGVDAIVFTAGIGQHQPEIRRGVARHLAWMGLSLSETANKANTMVVSARDSDVTAMVIGTDEEQVIADEAVSILAQAILRGSHDEERG